MNLPELFQKNKNDFAGAVLANKNEFPGTISENEIQFYIILL